MSINSSELSKVLSEEILNLKTSIELEEIGYVIRVGDGVANVHGLYNAFVSEKVEFESGTLGMVINLEQNSVGIIILGDNRQILQGEKVKRTKKFFQTPVGEEMIGRVVNALGVAIDGGEHVITQNTKNVEVGAPSVMVRESIKEPLQTGIKIIDAMIPIGKGQRELIIGDRQTGKTSIALDTIVNQKTASMNNEKVFCVYVSISQKTSNIVKILKKLQETGAISYTIIVSASASDSVAMQFLAPYTGCSIGEYFRDKGQHALVIYDDLSKHAVAYRQISLLLRRPPGREAYPGDIFFLHSRLLERAAKLSKDAGGGSLTALPIVETQAGDISSYIPTNVISITDGQIFLETELFNKGIMPAINIGNSVSRVGSASQIMAIRKLSGTMKLELAQFRELESFMQFSSSLDKNTQKSIESGLKLIEILKQENFNTSTVQEQVVILFLVKKGFLQTIDVDQVKTFESSFLSYMHLTHKDFMENLLSESGKLSESSEENLSIFIRQFLEEAWLK